MLILEKLEEIAALLRRRALGDARVAMHATRTPEDEAARQRDRFLYTAQYFAVAKAIVEALSPKPRVRAEVPGKVSARKPRRRDRPSRRGRPA